MNLIDTHAHLYWDSYKADFEEVIKRCKDAGIIAVVNVGVDIEKSKEALRQAQGKLTGIPELSVYSTIGIHPHEALRLAPLAQGKPSYVDVSIKEDMEKLEEIYRNNPEQVVGIGECGLDFYFDDNPGFNPSSLSEEEQKDLQKKLFQAQIDLAKKLNLPLSVHCRDDRSKDPQNSECWDTAIDMTKDHFGVYHCYSGLSHTTNYLLSRSSTKSRSRILDERNSSGRTTDFFIAFAGNLTYPKNEYLREAVKLIPLNRILLETDSPFLAPQSKRGQRNEPAAVKEIAQLIADLKEVSLEEVASQTTQNAKKIFNI